MDHITPYCNSMGKRWPTVATVFIHTAVTSMHKASHYILPPLHLKKQFYYDSGNKLASFIWQCSAEGCAPIQKRLFTTSAFFWGFVFFVFWVFFFLMQITHRGIAQLLPRLMAGTGECSGGAAGREQLAACLFKHRGRTVGCEFKADEIRVRC